MDIYTVTTPPNELPVTLTELKEELRITWDYEDSVLERKIVMATNKVELYTGRCLITRTILGEFDFLSFSRFMSLPYDPFVEIKKSPVKQDINTIVQTIDENAVITPITDYIFQENFSYSRVLFPVALPSMSKEVARPLQIIFQCGYGLADDIPPVIIETIYQLVNFYFHNKGDCGNALKGTEDNILKPLSYFKVLGTF